LDLHQKIINLDKNINNFFKLLVSLFPSGIKFQFINDLKFIDKPTLDGVSDIPDHLDVPLLMSLIEGTLGFLRSAVISV